MNSSQVMSIITDKVLSNKSHVASAQVGPMSERLISFIKLWHIKNKSLFIHLEYSSIMQVKPKENTYLGLYYFICLRAFWISLVSALKCDIHAISSAFLHVLH